MSVNVEQSIAELKEKMQVMPGAEEQAHHDRLLG